MSEKHIKYWMKEAEKDLPVADSMYEKGYYNWALFIGHLVLEKILKAKYTQEHKKLAPRIHDLVKIVKSTSLELTEEQLIFLSEVTDFNLEGRYPDENKHFTETCTKEFAEMYLTRIKELYQWLKRQIEK